MGKFFAHNIGGTMNLNQLGYFEAVYEKRSYSAAAKSIPMTHQGLIKSISTLQKELGVPLFSVEEETNTLIPTPYAHAFHEFAQNVQRENGVLDRKFDQIKRTGATIRLGSSTGVLGLLGTGFLGTFRAHHDDIAVADEEIPDLLCDEGLIDGRYDLALTIQPYEEDFETIPLYCMNRYVWAPVRDRLSKLSKPITMQDIAGYHVGVMGRAFKSYPELLDMVSDQKVELASVDTSSELFWLSRYASKPHHVAFTAYHVIELFAHDP